MTPDAAIVLTAAFAAGLIARALRLPPLLGFLAAGSRWPGPTRSVRAPTWVGHR